MKDQQSLLGNQRKLTGFTLIEVMLVIALIGVMVTVVQFNVSGNEPEETLKKTSARFAGIFDIAAEYGLLNNVELGLLIDKDSYQFLGYDGVKWSELPENEMFASTTLPENVEMILQLDDLPIEEPLLFDSKVFQNEDDEFDPDEEKKLIPQVYLLSGGDITPFSLTFKYIDSANIAPDIAYRVTGIYTTPLTIEGPTLED